jgi:hypothetical protein
LILRQHSSSFYYIVAFSGGCNMGRQRILFLSCLAFSLLLEGCGMMDAKYVKYDVKPASKVPPPDDGGSDSCQAAVTAFSASKFKSRVDDKCAGGCHGSGQPPKMEVGSDSANRKALLSSGYFTRVAAEFVANIQGHSGGAVAADLVEADVADWIAAEAACTN